PDSNVNLLNELNYTRSSILYVLKKYGIEPHALSLLNKPPVDESRIISDSDSPLDTNLKEHPSFQRKAKPLAEEAPTCCDVRVWGYDLGGSPEVKSRLIVKARNEAW